MHATTQTQHQVKCRLLLDVVVAQSASVLQLLCREDQSLLIRWDAFLILELLFNVLDGVRRLDLSLKKYNLKISPNYNYSSETISETITIQESLI